MKSAAPTRLAPKGESPGVIRGVETFGVGDYPGDQPGDVWSYGPDEVQQIARNFALLSEGENPLHSVPVVVTHDDTHAYGWVDGAKVQGDLLVTDWRDVAPELKQAVDEKRLLKVSPEIKRDFTDRDGKVYPGPYLYRVAVLGADVPRVKGLADIPARFADALKPGQKIPRTFRFAGATMPDPAANPADPAATVPATMTRDEAVQYLTEMGIDPTVLGPDVPDATILAFAQAWQDDAAMNPDSAVAGGTQMDDPPAPTPKKVSVTQHYADPKHVTAMVREIVEKETRDLRRAAKEEQRAREERAAAERQAQVRLFCDQRAKDGKLTPAECDEGSQHSVLSRLLRLAAQPQTIHKFSDGGKEVAKSELQLQQEEIDRREVRRFSERVRQGDSGANGSPAESEHARKTQEYWEKRAKRLSRN